MKKILSVLSLLLIGILLVSCGNKEDENPPYNIKVELIDNVSIIVPNGPPYMAVAGLLGNENLDITAVAGPSNLQSALVSGSHDIVIAPVNLGAKLYGLGNSKYQISHILTSNNAYVVTRSENKLDSILDLTNQEVLGFGATGVPGNVLKKLYNINNMDISKIDFQYQSSSSVYTEFIGTHSVDYALMSEPEISKLVVENKMEIKTLDLCELLETDFVQACVFVNPESTNQEDINKVLAAIKENVQFMNSYPTSYIDHIISVDRTFGLTGRDVLIYSIPKTNVVFLEAKTNKAKVETVLMMLGVISPNESFYR